MTVTAICTVLWLSSPALTPLPDEHEQEAIAAVLIAEAGGEGRVGMEAVAEVILNRSIAARISLFDVVTKPKQFSCLNRTTIERLIDKSKCHSRFADALEIVRQMAFHPDDFPRRTRGADHFSRKDEQPWWARGRIPIAVIGNHAFYRLNDQVMPAESA
ncbi:MAG: cell wall hydrolase [Planctomycetes bacterium]|nr:cell wall hydrolase [Planctomycetota bacterium]MBI3846708.1 cell wall hydrolase [Planctomycetota bacterium]